MQLRAELKESEERRKELEKDLRYARENAEEKAEELSQLIAQTMEYESGEAQIIAGKNIGFCETRSKQAACTSSRARLGADKCGMPQVEEATKGAGQADRGVDGAGQPTAV